MATRYLLSYEGVLRPFDATSSIGTNKVIRLLKPTDDRNPRKDFRVSALTDYREYRVVRTETVAQEEPAGGLHDVTILFLERIPDVPKPPPITLGG